MQLLALPIAVTLVCIPTFAMSCDLILPSRPITIAEQVAGAKEAFGGTVIGYQTEDGEVLLGQRPVECTDLSRRFPWWFDSTDDPVHPKCRRYLDTNAALFRVDTPIVGPATGETTAVFMTWGDGDCNVDFEIGEKWLIAGGYQQMLRGPIREEEVALLKRLASHPPFDVEKLYR